MSRKYNKAEKNFIKNFDKYTNDVSDKSFYKIQFDYYYKKYNEKIKDKNFDVNLEELVLNRKMNKNSGYISSCTLVLTTMMITLVTNTIISYMINKNVEYIFIMGVAGIISILMGFVLTKIQKDDDELWAYIALKALKQVEKDNKVETKVYKIMSRDHDKDLTNELEIKLTEFNKQGMTIDSIQIVEATDYNDHRKEVYIMYH